MNKFQNLCQPRVRPVWRRCPGATRLATNFWLLDGTLAGCPLAGCRLAGLLLSGCFLADCWLVAGWLGACWLKLAGPMSHGWLQMASWLAVCWPAGWLVAAGLLAGCWLAVATGQLGPKALRAVPAMYLVQLDTSTVAISDCNDGFVSSRAAMCRKCDD